MTHKSGQSLKKLSFETKKCSPWENAKKVTSIVAEIWLHCSTKESND